MSSTESLPGPLINQLKLTDPLSDRLTEPLIEGSKESLSKQSPGPLIKQVTDLLAECEIAPKPIIAIDAGGVLVFKTNGDETEESRKPIHGAFEALTKLKELGYELNLISFAGRKTAILNIEDMAKFYPNLLDRQFYVKNKLEKLAVCRSIGAIVLIDDTLEILQTLHQGLYQGTKKEIKSMDIQGVLFTGDSDESKNLVINEESRITVAKDWSQVVTICENLIKKTIVPDDSIELSRFVYSDLCIPPVTKPNVIPVKVKQNKSKKEQPINDQQHKENQFS